MAMKRSLLILAMLFLLAPAFAQDSPPEAGLACTQNDDCIKIDNNCGGMAINKAFLDAYEMVATNVECKQYYTLSIRDVPRCISGACGLYYLSDDEFRQEWPKCDETAQCTVMYDGCEDFAVNKKYVNLIKPPICPDPMFHNPKLIVECVNKKCTMELPGNQ